MTPFVKKNFWKNFGKLGVFMNMKYIITESRLEKVVLDFLDSNLTPFDGWNPEEYMDEVESSGELFLFLEEDSEDSIFYISENLNEKGRVFLPDETYDYLTDLFGKYWKPVFIKWFEENTKLPTKSVGRD